jgi:hypothetical protein
MKALRSMALIGASLALSSAFAAQEKASTKTTKKPAAVSKASLPPPLTLAMADPEQLLAASLAFVGNYDCEFKQVLVVAKSQVEGYVDVLFNKMSYTMKPVRSATGALRLEQVGGPMLMVQIPAKSMLMDSDKGKRVVDACIHAEQAKEVTTENSLDMNLPGQVNTAATTAAAATAKR